MNAVIHTYDQAHSVEQETYEEIRERYNTAMVHEDRTFEFKARTQAFQGPLPVTVPLTDIRKIEAV